MAPYKRQSKPYYKRKPRTRYQNYAGAAKQLYRDVRKLKQLVNVEINEVSLQTTQTPGFAGYLLELNQIAQGDTDSTRNGDSVKLQKLHFRCHITNTRLALARLVIIWDQDQKVAVPGDVYDQIGNAYAPMSMKDFDLRFQSKILYDRVIKVDPYNQSVYIDKTININKHTNFENGTTTVNTGSLKMLLIGDASVTLLTSFRWNSRLTFTDN